MNLKFEKASSTLTSKTKGLPETDTEALLPEEIKKILSIMPNKDRKEFNYYMASIIAKKSSQENEIGLQNWLRDGVIRKVNTGTLKMSELIEVSNKISKIHARGNSVRPEKIDEQIEKLIELTIQIARELAFQ